MTSIDFLAQKIIKYSFVDRKNSQINLSVPFLLWEEWYEEAEEMNKQNIIKSNRDGVDMVVDKKPFITGEEYYNETFKK